MPLSGRITDVGAWREGWVAVIESCVTEIGLSLETRIWIAVDANHDTLRFRVDADGPERSWQRNLQLVRGVLSDTEHGEIWDFKTGSDLDATVAVNRRGKLLVGVEKQYVPVGGALMLDPKDMEATFALGSGLAGLGGALGVDVLGLDPNFAIKYLVYFLLVVVVGGPGSVFGTLLAALLLGVADISGKYYAPGFGAFIIYAAMIILLLLFPHGLMGRRKSR